MNTRNLQMKDLKAALAACVCVGALLGIGTFWIEYSTCEYKGCLITNS